MTTHAKMVSSEIKRILARADAVWSAKFSDMEELCYKLASQLDAASKKISELEAGNLKKSE